MIFNEIRPYFFRKIGKMSQNLSSDAVVIGTLRVNRNLLCWMKIGVDHDQLATFIRNQLICLKRLYIILEKFLQFSLY